MEENAVMEQPIEEVVETPIEEVVVDPEATEEVVEEQTEEPQEEKVEEQKEFDPDELEFEEEEEKIDEAEMYTFDEYNLEAYKDIFDFETPESRAIIQDEVAKLKAKGYSQEKVEGYIDALLERESNKREVVTAETVKAELNESLSKEEKANYKAIGNWLRDGIKGTEFEGAKYKDIMSNPQLVKLMNTLYKQSIGKNGVKTVEMPKPTPKVQYDYMTAMGSVQDKIMSGMSDADLTEHIKDMASKMKAEDLERYKESIYNSLKIEI